MHAKRHVRVWSLTRRRSARWAIALLVWTVSLLLIATVRGGEATDDPATFFELKIRPSWLARASNATGVRKLRAACGLFCARQSSQGAIAVRPSMLAIPMQA